MCIDIGMNLNLFASPSSSSLGFECLTLTRHSTKVGRRENTKKSFKETYIYHVEQLGSRISLFLQPTQVWSNV